MKPLDSWGQRLATGLKLGIGLGLVLILVELLKNIPLSLKAHFLSPVQVLLVSSSFLMLLGIVLGVICSPLLALRFGRFWHAVGCCLLYGALTRSISPDFDFAKKMEFFSVILVFALYLLALALSRKTRWARIGIAAGILLALTAAAMPRILLPSTEAPSRGRSRAPDGAPNIAFIVIDTVRGDHLGFRGHSRETAPWIERFATEGAIFQRAVSSATWTLPSHASMFTGLYPSGHGAHHENNYLDESLTTIAEILNRYGWQTVGFNSNPWITDSSGMTQGFTYMDEAWLALMAPQSSLAYRIAWNLGWASPDHGGQQVADAWVEWVSREWDGERPFFVYLNFLEAHAPYHQLPVDVREKYMKGESTFSQQRYAADRAQGAQFFGSKNSPVSESDTEIVRDLYNAGIRYDDDLVSRSLEALEQRGALDNTLVVIVSDHGELLGEHEMFGHEAGLSEYLLDVPLIMRWPGRIPAGLEVSEPVSTVALFPTLLDLAGIPVPDGVHTRSFAPLFDGDAESSRSPIFSEQHGLSPLVPGSYAETGPFDRLGIRYRSLEEDGWKLVVDSEDNRWLFRPQDDPAESVNLADQHPEKVEELVQSLNTVVTAYSLGEIDAESLTPGGANSGKELDPEVKERLRALGYAQ